MILCLFGLIVFIKVYDFTPEKTARFKVEMKREGLQRISLESDFSTLLHKSL
jgi:hypothetical protein